MHDQLHDSPQEIDRQLAVARRALQEFEDGVDRRRLILRLRTASPAHPVLLFRFMFGALGMLFVLASVAVLAVAQINSEVARAVAKFEMVSPLPEEIPLLPSLLGVLAGSMLFAWLMATFAAWALGRDAPLLAWEQKQHQKLVNEVTRMGTQKAVTERIRNTPAGARPRIATPAPTGVRQSGPSSPPTGAAFNRAGLGTPSHSPAQSRSFGPQSIGPQSIPGYTGSVGSAPPSQPRIARHGVQPVQPHQSAAAPQAMASMPPASSTPPVGSAPGSGFAPQARPSAAPRRDRGGLGGLSSSSNGQPSATGVRFGQAESSPVPAPESSRRGAPPDLSRGGAPPDLSRGGAPPDLSRGGAPPEPSRQGAPPDLSRQGAPPDLSRRGAPPDLSRGGAPPEPMRPAPLPRPAMESAPTQPMVRPGHSLRPREAPAVVRDAATPTRAEPPRPEPARAAPLRPEPAHWEPPPTPGERPSIVLPPLGAGPLGPGIQPGAPVHDDETTVEHDDLGSNGSNGAPNRALDAGRIVGVEDGPMTRSGGAFEPGEPPQRIRARESAGSDGILGQAQAGTNVSRPTPYGSAGRVRLPAPATLRIGNAPMPMGQSTRGGTPLGAPPKAGVPVGEAEPRLAEVSPSAAGFRALSGFPGTPDLAEDRGRLADGPVVDLADMPEIFGSFESAGGEPPGGEPRSTGSPRMQAAVVIDEETLDEDEDTGTIEFDMGPAHDGLVIVEESDEVPYDLDEDDLQDEMPTILPTSSAPSGRMGSTLGRVDAQDTWLTDAISRADALARSLPAQAELHLSREPHLPFTLVITRATPALAVRAMVHFVEFLASISTPPRARIELVGVAHLDRSFHKNVVAALEPYFGANSEVRPNGGQVDIRFTDPDPRWSHYPRLPG
jgi:hypothetical protein